MLKDLKWLAAGIFCGCLFWYMSTAVQSDPMPLQNLLLAIQSLPAEKTTLTVGRTGDAISLDPAVITDNESLGVTINIYDTLVRYDQSGMSIKPGLANRWTVSEDGLVWKFYMRHDIYFHDGTPLNADAVVFNFNRWKDIDNPYHAGHFTYWNMSFGGFPGIVDSVQAMSDDTVEIVLNKPYAPFLSTLAMPAFGIASPDAITKYNEDLKYRPVGTGAFVFKSWTESGEITLEKNTSYWEDQAKIDRLVFKAIPNRDERVAALKDGSIQIAYDLSKEEIDKVKHSDHIQLLMRPYFNVGYLSMNLRNPYMYEKKVRQAIANLIDKNAMIHSAFDFSARPASTFVPPVIWGYNEAIQSELYNPERSKELLKSVELEKGFKVELLVMDEPRIYFPKPLALAEYIKKTLAQANIEVHINAKPWEEVIRLEQNGDYDMVLAGWSGDVADPDNFLYTFFSSENAKEGVVSNYSYYENATVDRLLLQARQATDKSFRNSLYRQIQELVAEDLPAIPLVHTMPVIGIDRSVSGYTPQINGVELLNDVSIKKEK